MLGMMRKLAKQLANPSEFFNSVQTENWKHAFVFFLWVTLFISVVTPIVNYLGIESTDWSSSYQAQIAAYNLLKNNFFGSYGAYAYLIEAALIPGFAIPVLFFLTLFYI
jgi:hypothetical protein